MARTGDTAERIRQVGETNLEQEVKRRSTKWETEGVVQEKMMLKFDRLCCRISITEGSDLLVRTDRIPKNL